MTSNSTCLGVVDLERDLRSHLYPFNVEEAVKTLASRERFLLVNLLDVMRCCVKDSEEKHGVSDLSMEPLRLIKR
jgi:hypothetical protein